jgi:endonuclease/exonuclease/phosphatase family metal-dependent hydrolase
MSEPSACERRACAFRLLTLNVHKGFSLFNRRFVLHELRAAVRSLAADVVCLQEVIGMHAEHSARHPSWPAAPQYEFLAETIWPQFAYGRNAVYSEGHHGNAVLSRYPIAHWENHDVSIAGPERRGLLHCVIRPPGSELHVVCAHLGLMEAHRSRQLGLMCKLVEREVPPQVPLFIAGDFNDWRLRAHRMLGCCAGLKESFVEIYGRAARSFPSRWPLLRLDRIYYRNARLLHAQGWSVRPWSHLSDHAPLTAEFELAPA